MFKSILAILILIPPFFNTVSAGALADYRGLRVVNVSDKFILFKVRKKYGYANQSGSVVIPPIYDTLGFFHQGKAFARKFGISGFISKSNYIFTKLPNQKNFSEDSNIKFMRERNLYRVRVNGLMGVLNEKGNWLLRPIYDFIHMTDIKGDPFVVKLKGKFSVISEDGIEVFSGASVIKNLGNGIILIDHPEEKGAAVATQFGGLLTGYIFEQIQYKGEQIYFFNMLRDENGKEKTGLFSIKSNKIKIIKKYESKDSLPQNRYIKYREGKYFHCQLDKNFPRMPIYVLPFKTQVKNFYNVCAYYDKKGKSFTLKDYSIGTAYDDGSAFACKNNAVKKVMDCFWLNEKGQEGKQVTINEMQLQTMFGNKYFAVIKGVRDAWYIVFPNGQVKFLVKPDPKRKFVKRVTSKEDKLFLKKNAKYFKEMETVKIIKKPVARKSKIGFIEKPSSNKYNINRIILMKENTQPNLYKEVYCDEIIGMYEADMKCFKMKTETEKNNKP